MDPSPPAIATKFVPPRVGSRSVTREALLLRLQQARHARLILFRAPAGYGKTTTIAQWCQRLGAEGARVAWLSLDPFDDDVGRLCAGIGASLQRVGVRVRHGSGGHGHAGAARCDADALISVLAGVPGSLYLVLDEMDHLRSPAVLDVVQALLAARLPGLHLVTAMRGAFPVPRARLLASGGLFELGSAELALDLAETLAFMRRRGEHAKARRPDMDDAVRAHEATGGWPAGLELLACQPQALPHRAALREYWDETVIAGLTQPWLDFLLRLSVLPRFNAELAASVTGHADAAALLRDMEVRGLFLAPARLPRGHAGNAGYWYALHPQLAADLRLRLPRAGLEPTALHARAAHWLGSRGYSAEALFHALLCGELDAVRGLVEAAAPDVPALSQLRDMVPWTDNVAPQRLARHPPLLLAAAWGCVVSARLQQARDWLRQWLAASGGDAGAGAAHQAALIEATIAFQEDDWPRAQSWLQRLEGCRLPGAALEQIRAKLASRCDTLLGRQPRLSAHYGVPARPGDAEVGLMACGTDALIAWTEGNAYEALRLGDAALAEAEGQHGRRSVTACLCAVSVAAALYERDRVDASREVLAGRMETLRFATPDVLIEAALCLCRQRLHEGAETQAVAGLLETEAHFDRRGLSRGVACMIAERARLALAANDQRHARSLQEVLDALAACHAGEGPREQAIAVTAMLARARLALAMSQPRLALEALEAVRRSPFALIRERLLVTADLLQAAALDGLGHAAEAAACLETARSAGMRLGLVRTFADEAVSVRELLRGQSSGKDRQPLAGSPAPAQCAPVAAGAAIVGGLGKPLTPREREILTLLEQSMTNKHIALALNLSVDTVKWNLRQIFGKLGVSRRYDAILMARSAAAGAD